MFLVPTTPAAALHKAAYFGPVALFVIAGATIVLRQSYFRNDLAEEDSATWDRIERRAYIRLPDGRHALIYPVVEPRVSPGALWSSLLDTLSVLP